MQALDILWKWVHRLLVGTFACRTVDMCHQAGSSASAHHDSVMASFCTDRSGPVPRGLLSMLTITPAWMMTLRLHKNLKYLQNHHGKINVFWGEYLNYICHSKTLKSGNWRSTGVPLVILNPTFLSPPHRTIYQEILLALPKFQIDPFSLYSSVTTAQVICLLNSCNNLLLVFLLPALPLLVYSSNRSQSYPLKKFHKCQDHI